MNARRRTVTDPVLPGRVYPRSGSWYWYPKGGQWIKLCRIEDGEAKMLERLAEEKRNAAPVMGLGNMPALIDVYVKEERGRRREKGWFRYGDYAKHGFSKVDIEKVDAGHVDEFLRLWKEKLPMQRAMRAFLNQFFRWCIINRHFEGENPCATVKIKTAKARDVYLTDQHFQMIRAQLAAHPMVLCMVDLCYLTVQRSTEIRSLRWKPEGKNCSWVDRDRGVIHFKPSKTIDSSGVAVDWPITPEIESVLATARSIGKIKGALVVHTPKGSFWTATAALKVWRKACNDAGLKQYGYTIRDLRAKALTDAQRLGYQMEELKVAAAHTDMKTTEIYMKARETPVSTVRLAIPKSA